MNDLTHASVPTRAGTIGGTITVTLLNIFDNDIIRTIGFAALGASVSFFVSLVWKEIIYRLQRWKKKRARRGRPGGDPAQQ